MVILLLLFISAGTLPAKSVREARKIFDQAFSQYSAGNYSKALELYETASQLDPDNAEIWMEYASCFRKVGRYQNAARAFFSTGESQGHYQEALRYAELALERHPGIDIVRTEEAEDLVGRLVIYWAMGDIATARRLGDELLIWQIDNNKFISVCSWQSRVALAQGDLGGRGARSGPCAVGPA